MLRNLFVRFAMARSDERGATAIEYALIAALIAVAAIVGMELVGTEVNATFQNVANKL
ncbi:Flp family type IVb pilin [Oleomonas cavernae]|uniref:Flp family type IVb pilin n=1 Tax=Oleomonas cavernae TaxID=2320859 RepID=A0A418WB76_9PROT|nr:Flp family type IVb pilin [Oleomonas cavernae]RJF87255.1 Flp family type IVb pilin [Oleomonas cavernae]